MNDDLDTKSDAELNKLFAVEVAGWRFHKGNPKEEWVTLHDDWWISKEPCDRRGAATMFKRVHAFTTDANDVLTWLERWRYADIEWNRITMLWTVSLQQGQFTGSAPSLPRATVLAILRDQREQRT